FRVYTRGGLRVWILQSTGFRNGDRFVVLTVADGILAGLVVRKLLARVLEGPLDLPSRVPWIARFDRGKRLRQRDVTRQHETRLDPHAGRRPRHGAGKHFVGTEKFGKLLQVGGSERRIRLIPGGLQVI